MALVLLELECLILSGVGQSVLNLFLGEVEWLGEIVMILVSTRLE